MSQREFHPGDVVSHRTWGIGLIVETYPGASPEVKIDFQNKPQHRMSLQLARSSLTILLPNGLEVLFIKFPEKLANWSEEAPLKLIGAALADINKPAKPMEIRNRIENKHLLKTSWDNWWKRVQPALRDSPQFVKNSNGSYELAVSPEQIPEIPLPAAPQKKKKEVVNSAAAKEIASKVLSGEVSLGDLKGAEVLKRVLKELLRKNTPMESASAAFLKVTDGPVVNIRIVIDGLNKAKRLPELIRTLEQIVSSVQNSYITGGRDIEERKREHVIAKLGLLEDGAKKIVTYPVSAEFAQGITAFTKSAFGFSLDLWQEGMPKWRADSISGILTAVAVFAEKDPQLRKTISTFIAAHACGISTKIGVTEELIRKFGEAEKAALGDEVLSAAIELSPQFAKQYFERHVATWEKPKWILVYLRKAFPNWTLESLFEILKKNRDMLRAQDLAEYAELVVALTATSSLLGSSALLSLQSELDNALSDALIGKQAWAERIPTSTLNSIAKVMDAKLRAEKEQSLHTRNEMESEIHALRGELEEERSRVARQEEEIKRLQSGYRVPEKWATFYGKKEIAEGLVDLYQGAFLSGDSSIDTDTRRWLLLRIEILLQRKGITTFGKVGEKEKYDPALHEFVAGTQEITDMISVVCPGFQWEDPSGNRIILSRARVSSYRG